VETQAVGKVVVAARVENLSDSLRARAGEIRPEAVRAVEVSDAVVDTGAKLLCLPKPLIEALGLELFETRPAQTSAGVVPCNLYRAVWLTVQGRRCTVDVAEVDDSCPVQIGYVPLELLDFVVDPNGRRLVGDPRHHGQNIVDLM
jgi:predicted aspartyl protease